VDPEQLTAQAWPERARALSGDGWRLIDLCGLDRLGIGGPRFQVVVQLRHHERGQNQTLHVVADGDPPTVPSIVEVWPTANFMEREAYDMFGIHFDGHPQLTRLLMPDEWQGHPLRKDYGVGKVAIEFAPQPLLQIDAPGQGTETEEAERDVDELGQSGAPVRRGNPPGFGGASHGSAT
jgi:NADH-quinone oxidoreductase subunit C